MSAAEDQKFGIAPPDASPSERPNIPKKRGQRVRVVVGAVVAVAFLIAIVALGAAFEEAEDKVVDPPPATAP